MIRTKTKGRKQTGTDYTLEVGLSTERHGPDAAGVGASTVLVRGDRPVVELARLIERRTGAIARDYQRDGRRFHDAATFDSLGLAADEEVWFWGDVYFSVRVVAVGPATRRAAKPGIVSDAFDEGRLEEFENILYF